MNVPHTDKELAEGSVFGKLIVQGSDFAFEKNSKGRGTFSLAARSLLLASG